MNALQEAPVLPPAPPLPTTVKQFEHNPFQIIRDLIENARRLR